MALPSNNGLRQRHASFLYAPLWSPQSQIRLLRLHPAAPLTGLPGAGPASFGPGESGFDEPIRCSILTASLDAAPPYKALSYCWGDNDRSSHSARIGDAALPITKSLDSALRHLRHRTEPITLWIDQICINQDDNAEKSIQVAMMAHIYRKAAQVLVWLGPAEKGSDEVMDFFAMVGQAIRTAGLDRYCDDDRSTVFDAAVIAKDPNDQLWQRISEAQAMGRELLLPLLQAVVDWDRREWFGRAWVVQEFCVGAHPVFICGRKRIPADFVRTTRMMLAHGLTRDFVNAVRGLSGKAGMALLRHVNDDPTTALFRTRYRRQRYDHDGGPGSSLFDLLRAIHAGRAARATLPVDRVFSLVALAAENADALGVRIDYSNTAVQALTDVAKRMIMDGRLEVLAYVQHPRDVHPLPSWVSDWRPNLRKPFYPYLRPGIAHQPYFRPSADRVTEFVVGLDEAVLGVGGYAVDVVEELGSVWTEQGSATSSRPNHQAPLAEIRFLCRLSAAKNRPIYRSRQRRDEAEWRVPIADFWVTRDAAPLSTQRAAHRAMAAFAEFRRELDWLDSAALAGPLVTPDHEKMKDEAFLYQFSMSKMNGMRPFMTNSGYVGMGPAAMCPGDVVAVFFGGSVCSVLRPRGIYADLGRAYLHIGEAYCDGVMDGELLGQREEDFFFLL